MADIVKFEKGEAVEDLRDKLNKVALQAASAGAAPGTFVGAGIHVQRKISADVSDFFQLIRGTAATAVTAANTFFYVNSPVALEENASLPTPPVPVANQPLLTLAGGDIVYAAYNKDCLIIPADPEADPPTEEIRCDWEAIPTAAGTSTPPLRWFRYVANKTLATATASIEWLDHLQNPTGIFATVNDPELIFHGKVDNYLGTAEDVIDKAFRGQALLRLDLATAYFPPAANRWDIITSEGYSGTIRAKLFGVSNYPSAGSHIEAYLETGDFSSKIFNWDSKLPAIPDGEHQVGYAEDLSVFDPNLIPEFESGGIVEGPIVIMELVNPDTIPPMYRVTTSKNAASNGKRIRGTVVDPGSGFVAYAASTFQIEDCTEVFGGAAPAGAVTVNQVFDQGYVAGQLTEAEYNNSTGQWDNLPLPRKLGCHIGVTVNGFEYVDAASLAGPGLGVTADACPKLRTALPPTDPDSTTGYVLVKTVDDVECFLSSDGVLKVRVKYKSVVVLGHVTGGDGNAEGEVDIWDKNETNVVTDATCSGGSIILSEETIEILTPPGA